MGEIVYRSASLAHHPTTANERYFTSVYALGSLSTRINKMLVEPYNYHFDRNQRPKWHDLPLFQ